MKEIVLEEKWKTIKGFEKYQISNFGRVKTLQHNFKYRIRKFTFNRGYNSIILRKKKKSYIFKVARLVAQHFIPNPQNFPEVNHKDGIKSNDIVNNLEWCTRSQNVKHAFRIGLMNIKGEKHPRSKLSNEQVKEIRKDTTLTQRKIAEKFGVHQTTIHYIKSKKSWNHLI